MKKVTVRIHRALLFVLAILPIAAALYGLLLEDILFGAGWLLAQTALMALLTLLPAFIGNYREYEGVKYEGSRGSDPNPDREAVHMLMKEGHRFPLRMTADLTVVLGLFVLAFFLPKSVFIGGTLVRRMFFAFLSTFCVLLAAHDLPSPVYIWEEIPGMLLGVLGYFGMSLYLQFTAKDVQTLRVLISVCAVLYLFFGAVALNKQSIAASMSAHSGEGRKIPRLIAVRNRRIVISFAALITAVSLVNPIRKAVLWVFRMIGKGILWVRMLFGYKPSTNTSLPFEAGMEILSGGETEVAEVAAEAVEESNLIVYLFLGFVGLAFLYLMFEMFKKLSKRLSDWMERFAHNVSEGFYDEKEELMTADELRDKLKNSLKNGFESLFKREKAWKDLDGRERARRLMKTYYKKRTGKVGNLRAKTAREVLSEGKVSEENQKLFSKAYEIARYSGHEVDAESMDQLKKDMKL